jgi:4-diphosphocytidyl-2-C-methyl-D-erythritol kinase
VAVAERRVVREHCRAKLNLFLDVRGRRPDGFHDLLTVFHEVELADELEASITDTGHVTLEVEGATAGVPRDAGNLAVRAVDALLAEAGSLAGVHLRLTKRVPVGSGLGGGSADAAAALRAVNALLGLGASVHGLETIGARIGSDVAFLVRGGTALARGRGELLDPINVPRPFRFRVIVPAFGLSTADVYRALPARLPRPRDPVPTLEALASGDAVALADACSNALLDAALTVEPRLPSVLVRASTWWGGPVHLTGSGSALFVVETGAVPAETKPIEGVRAILPTASADRDAG